MTTRPANTTLRASDVKQGHWVTVDGEKWQVVSAHPEPSTFWVQRYVGDRYETNAVHVKDMGGWKA